MSDVVVTGMGVVSAYGRGVPALLDGLATGRPPSVGASDDAATRPIDRAVLDGAEPASWLASAIDEALAEARWPSRAPSPLLLLAAQAEAPPGEQNPLSAPNTVVAGARRWDRPLVVSHACASALFGIHLAARLIRGGAHDAVLVAGVSVCNPYASESLRVVKAIGTAPSRPFDRARDGILIGEGSGAVLLERASAAAARGVTPLAELAASVAQIGGRSSVASDPEVVYACMVRALDEAGASGLDYVHAHATGTVQGDEAELQAVARLVAERAWPAVSVSSHKGALGHLLHASAFPGVAVAVSAVRDAVIPTTVGLREPVVIDGVDLPVEGSALRRDPPVEHVLVNAFGFGGNNASVLLRRIRPLVPPRTTESPDLG